MVSSVVKYNSLYISSVQFSSVQFRAIHKSELFVGKIFSLGARVVKQSYSCASPCADGTGV